jgi:HB1, ASXL, restriction endonuclease HTH domain
MASKKSDQGSSGSLPALKIGSRVRCTDDGVQGRITWANAIAVKVQWDDGEQVTWRRDSLTDRPIEILDPADEEGQNTAHAAPIDVEQSVSTESPREELSPAALAPQAAMTEPTHPAAESAAPITEPTPSEPVPPLPEPAEVQTTPAGTEATVETPVTSKRRRKAPADPKEKKFSALDAAARVLAEAGQAMNCQEMIAAMAAKNYWSSPGGKTPAATLYSAILLEIRAKGAKSRFQKTDRGKFARTGAG